jgi:putative transposase
MILSDFGKIVDNEWNLSFEIRNELFCDEYIIMPNHLKWNNDQFNPKKK